MRAFPFRACLWTVIGAASAAMGCADYKPGTDMPALRGRDSGPFASENAEWSCLQKPAGPPSQIGSVGEFIVYSVQIVDLATQGLLLDATVKACALSDVDCRNPVISEQRPGADGWVNLPLRNNFQGFLQIESPNEVLQLFHPPDTGLRTMRDYPIVMISQEVFAGLVQVLRLMDDPSLGAIAVRTFDCQGELAPDVVLKSDVAGVPYYFEGAAPSIKRQQTDSQGLGGFVGIQPGFALSEATLLDGTEITSQKLVVRPGALSTGFLRPPQASAP
jgi:hypothetical protein